MANARVQQELIQYQEDDSLKFQIDAEDNDLTNLRVTLSPPEGSPYEEGIFFLKMTVPPQYPATAPVVTFDTKIYHPNISEEGKICLQQLKDDWKPNYTLRHAIDFVYCLLENPNWENPLMTNIGAQHAANPAEFENTAREWTRKYAC